MNNIEDILDHFGEHASPDEIASMEDQVTFEDGLKLLQQYASAHLAIDAAQFTSIKDESLRKWFGQKSTVDDLWTIMFYMKDGSEHMKCFPANIPADQEQIPSEKEIKGLGKVIPGKGEVANATSRSAYFRHGKRTYKARVNNGKVEFVKYARFKRICQSLKGVGISEFSVNFDIKFDEEPHNNILSKLFHRGCVKTIDWVISLMHSGDIRVSKDSSCSGVVPHVLAESNGDSMVLSQSIGRHYFAKKKFLYDETTGDLYWVPCDGITYMKVIVDPKRVVNSFSHMNSGQLGQTDENRLKNCLLTSLEKDFV